MRLATSRLLLIIVSVCIALIALEVTFRIIGRPQVQTSGWRSKDFVFTKSVPAAELNQFGYRGQKIEYSDDDFVIALVGDSQVEARACAYEWMPERRLQYHLNSDGKKIKVFTIGATSYGQDQELLALKDYFQKFRANLVVVWLTPQNDIWNNVFPTNQGDNAPAKPTFWLENGQLRGPSEEQIGQRVRGTPALKLAALWRRFFAPRRDREWETKYLPEPYQPMSAYSGPVQTDWQQFWDTNFGDMRNENLSIEKSNFAMLLTPRSRRTQYGLDLTHKLLEEIRKLAAAQGSQFLVFESLSSDDRSFAGQEVHVLNGKYYQTSGRQFRDNVAYIVEGLNYHLIPVTLEPHRVGPEDSHLNEHAVDELMRSLSEIIKGNIKQ
jgi:hypothetical protein